MADLNISIQKTLVHEGGYVDNPADSGGPTKFGITQADMPGQNIEDLTPEQAIEYYLEHYVKPGYSEIQSQDVCNKLFDMGVLFGIGEAVHIFQLVLNVGVDGVFGPETLQATNEADADSLLQAYKTSMATHAFQIATANPKDRIFLTGWVNRINS